MEQELFEKIRAQSCKRDPAIKAGKMMSSEAITHHGKVFAFFSRKKKMVFKLGKDFNPDEAGIEMAPFSPFKNRAPLNGWFELPFTEKDQWSHFTERALNLLKSENQH